MKVYKKFGSVLVDVKGVNLDVFLNRVIQAGMYVSHVTKVDDKNLKFRIACHNLDKLIALFRGSCYTLTVIKFFGAPVVFNFFKKHVGLLAGLSLALLLTILFSQFVWRVEVSGNERLSASEVKHALAELGVSKGKYLGSINSAYLEVKLKQKMPDISLVSLSTRGTTVIVNLIETVKLELGDEDVSLPIRASHDAQITSILVLEGTAVVRVGDSVVAGQVMIQPYTITDTGEIISCNARGEVVANVWYFHTVSFAVSEKVYARTGRKVTTRNMQVFGLDFVLADPKNPYADFELEKKTVYMFNNNLIPIKITYTTYYETQAVVLTNDYDITIENIKYQAKILAIEKVPPELAILDERFSIKQIENTYYVSLYIKTSQTISIR